MSQRILYGTVNLNGSQHVPSLDYRVTPRGWGRYLIQFSQSFPSTPGASVSQNFPHWGDFNNNGGSTLDNAVIVALDKNQMLVKTGNNTGEGTDRNFSFLVIGPETI